MTPFGSLGLDLGLGLGYPGLGLCLGSKPRSRPRLPNGVIEDRD